jgi:hypothetical protein
VELQPCIHPLKKPIDLVKSHEIQAEIVFEIKKSKMKYMDKRNGKQFKLFEIKMAWWLVPLPSPKEMKVQSP